MTAPRRNPAHRSPLGEARAAISVPAAVAARSSLRRTLPSQSRECGRRFGSDPRDASWPVASRVVASAAPPRRGRRGAGAPRAGGGDVGAGGGASARAGARWPALGAAPGTLLEPARAACQAFAVVVLAGHLAALAVEHDERRGATPARAARMPERVRREVGGIDGRGGHAVGLPRT
jgi:hypothetical protein